jgi:signal-transduction protein with cAMP-binding, CBS, and nucleotidyltransferase domain
VKIMRQKALRRLPITDDGRPVGVVSLGDVAMEQDPNSALAGISEAPPND